MRNTFRSFVLISFVLLTALSLPPRVRGSTTYSDVFPAALSTYSYGGWQGPFGDGTAGRLFPTSDGTGIFADATYNGLVWALRSSPEFSSIDMTMHFSIPNRDFTTADYFALLLILHSPTTPLSTPPGTNCDGTCSYVAGQSGFKILYRIGFNQLVITNGPGDVTLSQLSLPLVALNQPHDARATYAAGILTVYLDSVQLVTLQTTDLPAGQIGFETYRTDLIVNTITLVGSPVPGFGLSASPASATITPGSSINATVTVASISGFFGTVDVSATTSTPSLTTSLNPSSVILVAGSNLTSTLTVNTGSFCGNETVTVTGTSGSATSSVTFTVTTQGQGQCTFDFSLVASPATLTIVTGSGGGSEAAIATLVAGVTTPVTFSITTALPTGVTALAFVSASCSPPCTSTVTLGASATAPSSSTVLTIQALGGGVTRTAAFTLVIAQAGVFDFSLATTPATLMIVPGGASGVETATATLITGVTTPVTFSITTPLPTGMTAGAFTPVSCGPTCSATVTLTASTTAPPGTTALTVQAVGGSVTKTATFNMVVCACTSDFSLAAAPATLTIAGGGPGGVETVTATLAAGATTPVTLSISSPLPTGVAASAFTPATCSPNCSSAVTLTASPTAPPGTTTLMVQAVGGGLTRTATFNVVVCACAFDFDLAATPQILTIAAGGPSVVETTTATVLSVITAPLTFSIIGLPVGVTNFAFTPASCSPTCSATVGLIATAFAPGSTTTVTIQAVGGGVVTHTTTFSLIVTPAGFDFGLTTSPSTLTIVPGGASGVENASATFFTGISTTVTFSIATVLPNGVTASALNPASCTPTCFATVTLTASASAPASTTTLTIQAVGGGITRTTTFSLAVCSCTSDFSLATAPATLTIVTGGAGGVETASATLVSSITTPVSFSITTPLPMGVTASAFTPSTCSPTCSAAITLTASATATLASTTLTIQATGGGLTRIAIFALVVTNGGAFDFSLVATPASLTILTGGSLGIESANATLVSGITTPIRFNLPTPLPSGVSGSLNSPQTCSPTCSTTLVFSASATAPSSTTVMTIQAIGGGLTRTVTFTLVVEQGPFDFSLAAAPSTLVIVGGSAGGVETASATLLSGVSVAVTFSITTALPTGVTAGPFTPGNCSLSCSATVILTASATAPGSTTVVTIQAVGGGVTRSTTLLLTVKSLQDTDGDGIFNIVDTQPMVFSNDFSDIPLRGTTYGTVLSRGDQCPTTPCQLTIQEVSPSAGILITASPTGGLTPASISVCGGVAILSVSAGDTLTVKCGSVTITVTTGAVQVTFVGSGSNAGIDGTATITAGNGITFQPATFAFTAPSTNTATITVTINGNTLPVAPGETTSSPFAIFTIAVVNPTGQVFSAGVVIKFDGSTSFATNGPITSYTWNLGDGTLLTNAASKVTHTYAVNGTYTVTLTVADEFGNSNSQSQTINVLPAPIVGSETFSHNLFVNGNRLVQNVTVQVTNPNSYPILVNVKNAGNCDTVCPFSDQSAPILLAPGQTKYISVVHTFSPLDQGQTFVMQVTVSFSTNTSNMTVSTYVLASSRTFSFRIS